MSAPGSVFVVQRDPVVDLNLEAVAWGVVVIDRDDQDTGDTDPVGAYRRVETRTCADGEGHCGHADFQEPPLVIRRDVVEVDVPAKTAQDSGMPDEVQSNRL